MLSENLGTKVLPREQAELLLFQGLQKLGLHVNGATSSVQAMADAFNQVQERYNSYQVAVAAIANENEALKQGNEALQKEVKRLTDQVSRLSSKPKD